MLSQCFIMHRLAAPLLASILAFAAIGVRLGVEATRHDVGNDTLYYVAWGEQAHEVGILHLYSVADRESLARWQRHAMNYGPVFAYYVWAQNALRRAVLGAAPYYHPFILLALLLPAALCYVTVGLTLRTILMPRLGAVRATTAALLYWLSPGVVMNSAYHGQTDALICLVMLITLWAAVSERWALAGVVWTLGVLVKPQPVLVAPVLLYMLYCAPGRRRSWLAAGVTATAVLLAAVGPFIAGNASWTERLAWFTRTYRDSFLLWNQTTNKAYNLWWIDSVLTTSTDPTTRLLGIPRSTWGVMLIVLAMSDAVTLLYRRQQSRDLVMVSATAALIATAAFVFATRVWDRYLIYGLVLMLPFAVTDFSICALYVVLSWAWWVNLLFSLHGRAVSAGLPVPPVWLTGVACALVVMTGLTLLRLHLGRFVYPATTPIEVRCRGQLSDSDEVSGDNYS